MADFLIIYDTATGRLKAKLAETDQLAAGALAATTSGRAIMADGFIVSAKIAAGIVGGALLQDSGVVSGKIAAESVVSGTIASGSITEDRLQPGISIDIAEYLKEPTYTSQAAISGASCVCLTSGKLINTALPHSGYLPAIGIIGDAVAAATLAPVFYDGRFSHGLLSGIVSGYWGQRVYLAASGQISRTAPAASGECVQVIGQIADNDSIFVFPEPTFIEIAQ